MVCVYPLDHIDLTESALPNWVDRARADRTKGRTGVTTEEREELRRLRKENRGLRTEREILKNAAALFVKQNAYGSRSFARRRRSSRFESCVELLRCPRVGSMRGVGGRSRRTRNETDGCAS